MPQVVLPALIAGGTAGLGATALGAVAGGLTLGAVVASAAVGFTSTLVLGAVSTALYKRPNADSQLLLASGGTNLTGSEPTPVKRAIVGQTRAGGAVFHKESTGNNKLLHLFIVYAAHEVAGFDLHYFGQETIHPFNRDLSTSRLIGPRYTITVSFIPQKVNAGLLTRSSLLSSFNFRKAFGSLESAFQISGAVAFNGNNNGIYRRVITREGDIDEDKMLVERIDNGNMFFEPDVTITMDVEAIWVESLTGTADQQLPSQVANVLPSWKGSDRARGNAWAWYQVGWNANLFPSGVENISALFRGANQILDPRGPATGYTNNPALILAWYLTDPSIYGEFTMDEINEEKLIAAANICDELVPLADGSMQKRYTCNGVFFTDRRPAEIINNILSSMAGKRTWFGGQWHIYAGAYVTPILEITEDDLRGEVRFTTRTSRRVLFNALKGLYTSPDNNYEPTEFRHQLSDTFKQQDGGTQLMRDIELPFTNNEAMAQRIARIELLYSRQQIQVSLPCKWSVMELVPGQTAEVTLPKYGWDKKAFEVLESTFVVGGDNPGIDLSLKETDSTIWDWDTSLEQEVDPAPDTNLPTPWFLEAPTSVRARSGDEFNLKQDDGTIIPVMRVDWDQGGDVSGITWIVHWRSSTGADLQYNTQSSLYPTMDILNVRDGNSYEVFVVAVNSVGTRSANSRIIFHTVSSSTEVPPDVDAFEVIVLPSGIRRAIVTMNNPSPDLSGFEVRFTQGFIPDEQLPTAWETMEVGFEIAAAGRNQKRFAMEFSWPAAPGEWTFAVKALSRSGIESQNAVFVKVILNSAEDMNYFFDVKRAGWPGTISDAYIDERSGDLLPFPQSIWTTYPTWIDFPTWNSGGFLVFQYQHPDVNLGSNASRTITSSENVRGSTYSVQASTSSNGTNWSSWTELPVTASFRYFRVRIIVTPQN